MNVPGEQPRSPYSGKPIAGDLEPFDLFSSDGEKLGTVVEVNDEFLVIEHGGFLGLGESHGRLPRNLVASGDEDGWYLSVDQDRAKAVLEGEDGGMTSPESQEQRMPAGDMGDQSDLGDRPASGAGMHEPRQGATLGDQETMRAYEEDLEAQTSMRQSGEVVARKEVTEDIETVEVPVTREEVHVERRPANETTMAGGGEDRFREDEVHVPVMEEEVQVHKVARPREEVVISKERVQDTERVSDTVRREHVDVENDTSRDDISDETRI